MQSTHVRMRGHKKYSCSSKGCSFTAICLHMRMHACISMADLALHCNAIALHCNARVVSQINATRYFTSRHIVSCCIALIVLHRIASNCMHALHISVHFVTVTLRYVRSRHVTSRCIALHSVKIASHHDK